MTQPKLRVVRLPAVTVQGYFLPTDWEISITDWLAWLRMAGLSIATLRLRRDHVRCIARRSRTEHPQMLTKGHLVTITARYTWSAEHRRSLKTSMNSFYEYCMREGVTDHNPVACLPKVKLPTPHPKPTPDHVWETLLATAAPRELLMARLAGEAGLRRAEIAQVHTDDLIEDLDGWSLLIRGKGGKQRIVPITNRLADAIHRHGPRGFLFPGQIDGHLSPQYVGQLISDLMPPGWSAHMLRHRYATRGYAGTGNLRALQLALGHSSVATTERYTAVSAREVRSVSDAASRPLTRRPDDGRTD